MEQTIRIGRATDNDIIITKSDISGHHAKVTLINNNEFLIEDLDSTNGTFVNGYRINKSNVSLNDEVRLSESSYIDLSKIFNIKREQTIISEKEDEYDFRKEFEMLKKVWTDYQKNKLELQKKHRKKTTIVRSAITLAPLFFWEMLQIIYIGHLDTHKDMEVIRFWQNKYIVFAVLGSTAAMYATGSMSIAEDLSALDENFRVKYVCPNPKCRTQLGNVPWQSYYNQGKCFRCGAIFK